MTLYEKVNGLLRAVDKDALIEAEMMKQGLDYKAQLHNVISHRAWILTKLREMISQEIYK